MLSLITRRADLPEEIGGAFAVRIKAYAECYGFEAPFAEFWVQNIGGAATALVSRIDGAVTVEASDGCDISELREFISVIGCCSLLAEKRVLSGIFAENARTGIIMEKTGGGRASPNYTEPPYKELYSFMCRAGSFGEVLPEYESWLLDISARVVRGKAKSAFCRIDGECVSSAMLLFISGGEAVLGAVCTLPEYRGRGLASHLVKELCENSGCGKIYLLCKAEMREFYERLGFSVSGEYGEIIL